MKSTYSTALIVTLAFGPLLATTCWWIWRAAKRNATSYLSSGANLSWKINIDKLKKTIKLMWNIHNIVCQNLFSNLPEWHHYNIAHTGTQKQQSLYVVTRKHQLVQNWLGKGNVNCELQVWMLFGTGTLVDPKWLICSWNTNHTVNMLFFHTTFSLFLYMKFECS